MLKKITTKVFLPITLVASSLLLSGCGASSIFGNYPQQISPAQKDISHGHAKQADALLAKQTGSHNQILDAMELGRSQQLAGDYQASLKTFNIAIGALKTYDQKAEYTVTGGLAQTSSVLTNAKAIPYVGPSFEHALLHQYQALNYYALGNAENALVEMRQADDIQTQATRDHQSAIDDAQKTAAKEQYDISVDWSNPKFAVMNQTIADTKSGFVNAYTYYFSGLMYQVNGQDNNAYIQYKKALSLAPNNPYLQQNVLRLGKSLGMNDYSIYRNQIHGSIIDPKKNQGQLVVIFEQDFVPARKQITIPIPTQSGILPIAVPYYNTAMSSPTPLHIRGQGISGGQTHILTQLQGISARALKDNMPVIIIRTLLSTALKATLENKARQDNNPVTQILANVYAIATTSADLRSWLTLPNNIQLFQSYANAGQQNIDLYINGEHHNTSVTIHPNMTTIVWAVGYPNTLYVKTFNP